MSFTTGEVTTPLSRLILAGSETRSVTEGILLQAALRQPAIAMDMNGNIVSSVQFLASVYRSFRLADLYGLHAATPRPAVVNMPFRAAP